MTGLVPGSAISDRSGLVGVGAGVVACVLVTEDSTGENIRRGLQDREVGEPCCSTIPDLCLRMSRSTPRPASMLSGHLLPFCLRFRPAGSSRLPRCLPAVHVASLVYVLRVDGTRPRGRLALTHFSFSLLYISSPRLLVLSPSQFPSLPGPTGYSNDTLSRAPQQGVYLHRLRPQLVRARGREPSIASYLSIRPGLLTNHQFSSLRLQRRSLGSL